MNVSRQFIGLGQDIIAIRAEHTSPEVISQIRSLKCPSGFAPLDTDKLQVTLYGPVTPEDFCYNAVGYTPLQVAANKAVLRKNIASVAPIFIAGFAALLLLPGGWKLLALPIFGYGGMVYMLTGIT